MSPVVRFLDADTPTQLRLARTSSVDEMRVSWTTSPAAAKAGGMAVQWGSSAAALNRSRVAATSSTYTASDLCGGQANSSGFHHPGVFQSAVLPLGGDPVAERRAGKQYYYKVGSDAFGWSSVRSFRAPKPVNPHASMSIIVTADMGETFEDGSQYHWEEPAAVNTTVHMAALVKAEHGVDVVLHPGDLAYATGYESEWDRFMTQIEPLSSAAPYMTGQGNHERDWVDSGSISIGGGDSGGECGVPTQSRFQNPVCAQPNTAPCLGSPASASPPPLELARSAAGRSLGPVGSANDGWYSFEQGSVHVTMVNTEMSSLNGTRQHDFLAADLAAVDRSKTPWVLVLGHRQMYSGNMMGPGNDMGDIEPLLLQHKVDIALWGHIHFAQASCPMYRAICANTSDAAGYDAPIHAVIGNAGQSLTALPATKAPWSIWNDAHYGFSHITVSNATHLRMDYYRDAPLDETASVYHSFEINRAFPRV
jgi:hypothetical protein